MSDRDGIVPAPALGLIEFDSIAVGVASGDAMVKASPIDAIHAGTVHPGKYLVLVTGDTASVEEAMDVGSSAGAGSILDSVLLPDAHPDVPRAITGPDSAEFTGEGLVILECATVASLVDAADAAAKAAAVDLIAVRVADGLGGKAYALVSGPVAEVEAAADAAVQRAIDAGGSLTTRVIASLHEEMAENLRADLRFMRRVVPVAAGSESTGGEPA